MDDLVRTSIGMMHGAGAMVLALGLVGATREGVLQGPAAAQTATVRAALATLSVFLLAYLVQAFHTKDPSVWTQAILLLTLRICLKRLFASDLKRIE
jgi:hypothetical protein